MGTTVFKYGRTTGPTFGEISLSRGDVRHEGTPEFLTEQTIVGHPKHFKYFSQAGDSGAWVLNMEGNVVGMITSGNEATKISYYTPISTIIGDIERVTGRKVTLA